jgi:hypothetical protein
MGNIGGQLSEQEALMQQVTEAFNNCKFQDALQLTQSFDTRFPGNAWVAKQLPKLMSWVSIQKDIESNLMLAAKTKLNSEESKGFLQIAENLAAPVPCLRERVARFKSTYFNNLNNVQWERFVHAAHQAVQNCDFVSAQSNLGQAAAFQRPTTASDGFNPNAERLAREAIKKWTDAQQAIQRLTVEARGARTEDQKQRIRNAWNDARFSVAPCVLPDQGELERLLKPSSGGGGTPTDDVPDSVRGSRTTIDPGFMDGACSGTIHGEPMSGLVGDVSSAVITITRSPRPVDKVSTDNPACHNCGAKREGANSFRYTGFFQANTTPFQFVFSFVAYDAAGVALCKGTSGTITITGKRR